MFTDDTLSAFSVRSVVFATAQFLACYTILSINVWAVGYPSIGGAIYIFLLPVFSKQIIIKRNGNWLIIQIFYYYSLLLERNGAGK